MWKSRGAVIAVAAMAAALALSACSSSTKAPAGGSTAAGSGSSPSAAAAPVKLTVLAAASLNQIFPQLAQEFQSAHPNITVTFSFGGSATLAAQITQGAPADVFASASTTPMTTVVNAGDAVGTPQNFVKNKLVIAVAPGNPKGITSLQDLTKPGLKVVLCQQSQPCGSAATTALADAKVKLTPVSLEPDVTSTLSKVELGEADAALVYTTDAKGSNGKVQAVDFAEAEQAINSYPIAVLKQSTNQDAAQEFVSFIESPQALSEFETAGFLAP